MKKKLLITGVTGFTGDYTLKELLDKSIYDIYVFIRDKKKFLEKFPSFSEEKIRIGDFNDFYSLEKSLNNIDIFLNIASLGFGNAPNIVKALLKNKVERSIFISTTGIFTNLNPDSKNIRIEAEELIKKSLKSFTILRPTMIYGDSNDRNICRLINYIDKKKFLPIFGSGKYLIQPIYVKDLANVITNTIMNPKSFNKCYNVAGGTALSFNDFINLISNKMQKKIICIHIPLWIGYFLFTIYEFLSKNPRIKYEQILRLNENKNFPIDSAKNELGFNPISIDKGIELELKEINKN